uniref:protein FAN isoform X2 n=1 Tax=Myxine glutinosa TaxID=7769 RepID=UPI00358EA155
MAFVRRDEVRGTRFSLLMLDLGEYYFEHHTAFYTRTNIQKKERLHGSFKICSKSLLFEPYNVIEPILKFPLQECTKIEEIGEVDADNPNEPKGTGCVIVCNQVFAIKSFNHIAPYEALRTSSEFEFHFEHCDPEDILPNIHQLLRASRLDKLGDKAAMITAILQSRLARTTFDTSICGTEDRMQCSAEMVLPLVTNPGHVCVTFHYLFFQPLSGFPESMLKIPLQDVRRLYKRRHVLKPVGLEVFCTESGLCSDIYLKFYNTKDRDEVYYLIASCLDNHVTEHTTESYTLQWQRGLISNYDYLLHLNNLADRSFNDLSQYPVFPWIIVDYTSPQLDLSNPATFRDLCKPIGALNAERLKRLLERFKQMPPDQKFMYGSHYSSPAYVLFYLVRVAPEHMLCFQNGRFDHADRMFNSIADTWNNCMDGVTDFKELIPEFFGKDPSFLENRLGLHLGVRQDGQPVQDVDLPPWASDSADFLEKQNDALESPFVSQRLNDWIDLIFGYKQRGDEAVKVHNVFHPLTYEENADLDRNGDATQKVAVLTQILEFGQTPKQLFTTPHPQRMTPFALERWPHSQRLPSSGSNSNHHAQSLEGPECSKDDFGANSSFEDLTEDTRVLVWSSLDRLQISSQHKIHKDSVTALSCSSSNSFLFSASQDSTMKMFSMESLVLQRSVSFSNMTLSSCVMLPGDVTVVCGSWDNNIYFYSVPFGRKQDTLMGHDDAISRVYWHSGLLCTASWDSTVKLWKCSAERLAEQKRNVCELQAEVEHDSGVTAVHMSPTCAALASGTKEGLLTIWDVETQEALRALQAHTGTVRDTAFSPDGRHLLSCGDDGFLKVVDVRTATMTASCHACTPQRCLVWDGNTALAGSENGELVVWDITMLRVLARLSGHAGAITCLQLNEVNGTVITGGEDRNISIWKLP